MAQELAEMKRRAAEVVRLLEEYRRLSPELDTKPSISHDRPPKRPWEDVDQGASPVDRNIKSEQTTAEQDMEIIRTKRATSTAAGASSGAGQTKSKYRKRSVSVFFSVFFFGKRLICCRVWSGQRATPPGKCHSCNIRETPEWRRGPDGARTLCNACGLRTFSFIHL